MTGPDPTAAHSYHQGVTDDATEQPAHPVPHTGNRLIDQALTECGSWAEHPPAEHHDRLSAVADLLTSVLENSRDSVQTPIPGLRPNQGPPNRGQ